MNRRLFWAVFLTILLVVFSGATALAETRYISDRLIVALRDVPKEQFTALATLPSDTAVEVLGEEGRFFRVRTDKGAEGYISKQYLTAETPKGLVIEKLQAEISRYKGQVDRLQERLTQEKGGLAAELQAEGERSAQLRSDLQEAKQALATSREELEALSQKYQQLAEDAKNVVAIAQERDSLSAQMTELQDEVTALEQENTTLLRSGVIKWFLAGGGVFLFGWLAGKVSRKKRRGL